MANDHVCTPLSVSSLRSDSIFSHSYSQARHKSCFLRPPSQVVPLRLGLAGMTAEGKARCGFDAFQKITSKAVRTRRRESTLRGRVSKSARVHARDKVLTCCPIPREQSSRLPAQTSSALTRLTAKLAEPDSCLRAPVWCRERVLDRWVRRTVAAESSERGAPPLIRAPMLAEDVAQVCRDRRALWETGPVPPNLLLLLLLMMLDGILFLQRMKSRGRKGQFPNGANEIKGPARCSHSQLYLRWGVQS